MTMPSIFFLNTATTPEEPRFFRDLNVDQVTNRVFAGMDDWKPLFYAALKTPDAILQQQRVMRDIEHAGVQATLRAFTAAMRDPEALRHRAQTTKGDPPLETSFEADLYRQIATPGIGTRSSPGRSPVWEKRKRR